MKKLVLLFVLVFATGCIQTGNKNLFDEAF